MSRKSIYYVKTQQKLTVLSGRTLLPHASADDAQSQTSIGEATNSQEHACQMEWKRCVFI